MGRRLQVIIGTTLLIVLLGPVGIVIAEEYSSCWVANDPDPLTGEPIQITRCRIAGGEIVDYASDDSVPGRLYPYPGTDLVGLCWYYSTADGNWRFAQLYGDGDALLGYSSGGFGGGFAIVTGRMARCTSEPAPITDPIANVWEYVTDYIHAPPEPELNPEQGDGVTGLATYVGIPIPGLHVAQLNNAGTLLDVEIEVDGVIIDWGDDSTSTYPANPAALAGYPDGIATHIYEVKGEETAITASYHWTARWRVAGDEWQLLAVPNTSTTVSYPVAEIISVITG